MGFLEDAIADIRRALECEPGSRNYLASLGWMEYLRHDYAAAVTVMDQVLKGNPHVVPALYIRALAYERLGKYDLAAAAFAGEELSRPHPLLQMRSQALQSLRSRRQEEAARIARKMEILYTPGFLNALAVSEVFAALGERDAAFRWLETSYQDRRHLLMYLKSDPAWDPIRTDPRFEQMTLKLGLLRSE
jgi:tetratricopeptide (TPR) repeat protein